MSNTTIVMYLCVYVNLLVMGLFYWVYRRFAELEGGVEYMEEEQEQMQEVQVDERGIMGELVSESGVKYYMVAIRQDIFEADWAKEEAAKAEKEAQAQAQAAEQATTTAGTDNDNQQEG